MEEAERALEIAMSGLEVAPRAQKVAVSGALQLALDRLRSARSALKVLQGAMGESRGAGGAS